MMFDDTAEWPSNVAVLMVAMALGRVMRGAAWCKLWIGFVSVRRNTLERFTTRPRRLLVTFVGFSCTAAGAVPESTHGGKDPMQ